MRFFLALGVLWFGFSISFAEIKPIEDLGVNDFLEKMVNEHSFSKKELQDLFQKIKIQEKALELIQKPYEAKPWDVYRETLVQSTRVQKGVEFWRKHHSILSKVSQEYGVPPEILVSILGIETHYGSKTGEFPVLDTLFTLAFHNKPRSSFFKKELEAFLLLAKEEGFPIESVKGSYAGAMGPPQFIASSYRHYAVDYYRANKRGDLLGKIPDSIASIANYLKKNGWKSSEPIASLVKEPFISQTEYVSAEKREKKNSLRRISLKKSDGTSEQWIGMRNFETIRTYNPSDNYAMAVYQLGQAIKQEFSKV